MMITVPTIGEPKIVASAAKLPAETAAWPGRDRPPSQLDQGQREARADHQKATMFKSSLTSEIIRFMFEPASCR